MRRHPTYICAPYGAPSAAMRAWNVARAEALTRLAVSEGCAPICVHSGIEGVYGPETPASRAVGMSVDVDLVRFVAGRSNGQLWVLLREDGCGTLGMLEEWVAWREARQGQRIRDPFSGPLVRAASWTGWEDAMDRACLGARWRSLRDAPANND